MDHKKAPKTAKSAVMQPKYRSLVERDRTKYSPHNRKKTNEALKKGLYFMWAKVNCLARRRNEYDDQKRI